MKGLCRLALAALFVAACSGGDGDITGPNSREQLLQVPNGGVLAIGVDSTTGATVETNKDDYLPGEVVHLVGRNWAPGETVRLHMTELPNTHADVDTNVTADATGGFSVHYYDVQQHDFGVTFTLTATGLTSGSVAVATFTDGTYQIAILTSPSGLASSIGYIVRNACNVSTGASTGTYTGTRIAVNANKVLVFKIPTPAGYAYQPPPTASSGLTVSTIGTDSLCVTGGSPSGPDQNKDVTLNYNATNTPPTANVGGPYLGNEGASVPLDGSASSDPGGSIASYAWTYTVTTADAGASCSFVNGTTATPSITCTDDGTYAVKLIVTDNLGASSTQASTTLTLSNVAPTATINAPSPVNPGQNFTVQLNGGTDVASNDIADLQYAFDCGDGNGYNSFGATASRSCTANVPNSQTVKGKIRDQDGGETEYQTTVSVNNAAPVANAGGPYNGAEGSAVALNGTGSSDTDGTISTYAWSYAVVTADAGASCSITNPGLANASITCNENGSFTVTLTVTDDDGATNSQTVALSLTNANPTANPGGPYSGAEGAAIQLSGSGNDPGDNDDPVLTYAWSVNSTGIDAGGSCTLSSATAQNPTVTCTDDSNGGNFTVSLTVSDDDGGTSTTQTANLTVTNANPVANAGAAKSGAEGSSIALSGSGNDPGNNDDPHLTYLWTVNDTGIDAGGSCSITNPTSATTASVLCDDNGSFTVSLQVSDDDGGSHTSTVALNVANANPTANPGGPYSGNEGAAIQLSGSGDDPGNNDDGDLTYQWSVNSSGIDAGGGCSLSSATAQNPTVTCTDDSNGGTFTVSLTVKDDDGGTSTTQSANLSVANVNPVAGAGGPYSGNEGANVSLTGSKSDAGSNDTHTYAWAWVAQSGVDAGASCSFTTAALLSPTVKCTDDGVFKLTLTVTDDDSGADSDDATLTLSNVNPTIAITSHVDGALFSLLNGALSVTGAITEAGTNDTHQCRLELDGVMDEIGAYSAATGLNCSPSVLPDEAGVYTLTIRVKDDDGGEGTASIMIVVYDPSAGFVTGGGWINSPAGAYKPNTALTGKATFGFVSKYKRGATTPDGNTEFQFHAGGMNFHSETYQWLVVNQAGTNAQFKGSGTINGAGSYTFMLWATDGGSSNDKFRIQITDDNNGDAVVYDNGVDQVIGGGSIVIQTGGKK